MGIAAAGAIRDGKGGCTLLGWGECAYRGYGIGTPIARGGPGNREFGGIYTSGICTRDRPVGIFGYIVKSVDIKCEVSTKLKTCGSGVGDLRSLTKAHFHGARVSIPA